MRGRRDLRAVLSASTWWNLPALLIACLMLAPIVVAALSVFTPTGEVWQHLVNYVLPRVLGNTLFLLLAVCLASAILGSVAAWLTAVCEFPARGFFAWALLLPLAMPGYVIAFALAGFFEPGGLSGASKFSSPNPAVASAACLSLTLYPYVYLLARQAFLTQGARSLEVAQSLGLSRWQGFMRVSLPLARPWIAAGLALVAMETLADFGTVSVFNYDTFTTAIYQAWFGLFSLASALQMSFMLLLLVSVALICERAFRARERYAASAGRMHRIKLSRPLQAMAVLFCLSLFTVAFALPIAQLLVWAVKAFSAEAGTRYISYFRASLLLAAAAALLIASLALVLSYSVRQSRSRVSAVASRVATLGYAMPGTVLAVGFFVAVASLSHLLTNVYAWWQPNSGVRIMLTGTLLVTLLAYAARFLAVAYGPIESAMHRITPRVDDAARGLGVGGVKLLTRVHVPMLRGGLATAALLVFVDVMKELPITLITRPFGWDTLAVRIFQMTSEGEWQRAAVPALGIVLAGVLPVVLLFRRSSHQLAEELTPNA